MNILFTGRGKSGSWKIRGGQLGAACDGVVTPSATQRDCARADRIVVVKKLSAETLDAIRKAKKIWALDVLDFYPQPKCSDWTGGESIKWVKNLIADWNPHAIIWPNQRMMKDCNDGRPGLVLYHHHRPGLEQHPISDILKLAVYEGSANYLSSWELVLHSAFSSHHIDFQVNPSHYNSADVIVAARGKRYSGYAQQHWKSNVKLANAHAIGVPFIGPKEDGYLETSNGSELWLDAGQSVNEIIEVIKSKDSRLGIRNNTVWHPYNVHQAASDLRGFLYAL